MTTLELAAAAAALGGVALLALFARPSTLLSLTLASTLLSGHSHEVGLPLADRTLFAATMGSLLLWPDPPEPGVHRRLRGVDVLLVAAAVAGFASALAARTLFDEGSAFRLLDAYGILPFLVFATAHRVFKTEADRRTLVGVLLVVGVYLSVTAVLEAFDADSLIWPRYITDRTVGIHQDRARGPFVEAAANGLALFACAVAAGVGASTSRRRAARVACALVGLACLVGVLLTLTRAAWIGAALGAIVGMSLHPRLRRRLPLVFACSALAVFAALSWIPGLQSEVNDRSAAERPVWDRLNTNETALAMVRDHPLVGVGWGRFVDENAEYARQADGRPLTGAHLSAHNVVLSHLAELGLLGASLWLVTLGAAVLAAWRGSATLDPIWRSAAAAIFVDWAVVAMFSPLGYAFANFVMWLVLGIAAAPLAWRRTVETEPAVRAVIAPVRRVAVDPVGGAR